MSISIRWEYQLQYGMYDAHLIYRQLDSLEDASAPPAHLFCEQSDFIAGEQHKHPLTLY